MRRKKRSIALNEYFRKYFSHFFAQVNIEVTIGHQRPKLGGVPYFFGNVSLSQNLFIRRKPRKIKHSTALLQPFRQHAIRIDL